MADMALPIDDEEEDLIPRYDPAKQGGGLQPSLQDRVHEPALSKPEGEDRDGLKLAVRGGLNFIQRNVLKNPPKPKERPVPPTDDPGPDPAATREAIPTDTEAEPARANAAAKLVDPPGAATPEEWDAVMTKVDPNQELDDQTRLERAMNTMFAFHASNGDFEAAEASSAALIGAASKRARQLGGLAFTAAQNGDFEGAVQLLEKAWANVPDGSRFDIQLGEGGNGSFVFTDINGQKVERPFDARTLVGAAMEMANGKLFWKPLTVAATSSEGGASAAGAEATPAAPAQGSGPAPSAGTNPTSGGNGASGGVPASALPVEPAAAQAPAAAPAAQQPAAAAPRQAIPADAASDPTGVGAPPPQPKMIPRLVPDPEILAQASEADQKQILKLLQLRNQQIDAQNRQVAAEYRRQYELWNQMRVEGNRAVYQEGQANARSERESQDRERQARIDAARAEQEALTNERNREKDDPAYKRDKRIGAADQVVGMANEKAGLGIDPASGQTTRQGLRSEAAATALAQPGVDRVSKAADVEKVAAGDQYNRTMKGNREAFSQDAGGRVQAIKEIVDAEIKQSVEDEASGAADVSKVFTGLTDPRAQDQFAYLADKVLANNDIDPVMGVRAMGELLYKPDAQFRVNGVGNVEVGPPGSSLTLTMDEQTYTEVAAARGAMMKAFRQKQAENAKGAGEAYRAGLPKPAPRPDPKATALGAARNSGDPEAIKRAQGDIARDRIGNVRPGRESVEGGNQEKRASSQSEKTDKQSRDRIQGVQDRISKSVGQPTPEPEITRPAAPSKSDSNERLSSNRIKDVQTRVSSVKDKPAEPTKMQILKLKIAIRDAKDKGHTARVRELMAQLKQLTS